MTPIGTLVGALATVVVAVVAIIELRRKKDPKDGGGGSQTKLMRYLLLSSVILLVLGAMGVCKPRRNPEQPPYTAVVACMVDGVTGQPILSCKAVRSDNGLPIGTEYEHG